MDSLNSSDCIVRQLIVNITSVELGVVLTNNYITDYFITNCVKLKVPNYNVVEDSDMDIVNGLINVVIDYQNLTVSNNVDSSNDSSTMVKDYVSLNRNLTIF